MKKLIIIWQNSPQEGRILTTTYLDKFWLNKEKNDLSGTWTCDLRIDVPVLYQLS